MPSQSRCEGLGGLAKLLMAGVAIWTLLVFAGCATNTPAPSGVSNADYESVKAAGEKPVQKAPRQVSRQELVDRLLVQAERALRRGRLTQPLHDNAYDRYRGVLTLSPGNAQALAGIQLVGQRYLALTRDALARSAMADARRYYQAAKDILGDNSLVRQLQTQLELVERRPAAVAAVQDEKHIVLPVAELNRKSEVIKSQLAKLARRVQETDEGLLIVARSDAEGRWIYQQMREAVTGYRLRGDIKVGRQPAIQLLPAF